MIVPLENVLVDESAEKSLAGRGILVVPACGRPQRGFMMNHEKSSMIVLTKYEASRTPTGVRRAVMPSPVGGRGELERSPTITITDHLDKEKVPRINVRVSSEHRPGRP